MIMRLIGDTATRRGVTLVWRKMDKGLEFVLWHHAWFVGIDKRP